MDTKTINCDDTIQIFTGVTLSQPIRLTKWTAQHPVTKHLRLLDDGIVEKVSTASQLYKGTVERIQVTVQGFADLLGHMPANDCLSYGVTKDDRASRVMSKKHYLKRGQPEDTITRTADHLEWSQEPTVFEIDYDPPAEGALSKDDLLAALYAVCPQLRECAHIWTASTSSCLRSSLDGSEITGLKGQRVYIIVAEGCDIPRAGDILFKLLWLKGFGHIKVSSAGSLLVRGLPDQSVWQPNRIDYCAPPVCDPPLQSCKPAPEIHGNSNMALDSRVSLPDLSPAQDHEYEQLVAATKDAKRAEAGHVRAEYQAKRVQELTKRGIDPIVAEQTIQKALDQQVLQGDFILNCQDGMTVTVAEVLVNKAKWHGKRFHDPIETDYHGDPRIARAYLQGLGRPYIHSFAHGGQRYYLARQIESVHLQKGERAAYSNQIVDTLVQAGEIYRRGNSLVSPDEDGNLIALTAQKMISILDCVFHFEKFLSKKWVAADAPIDLAIHLLDAHSHHFHPLKAVLTAPSLNPQTGCILAKPGYDLATHIFLAIGTCAAAVPEEPTQEQIKEALAEIWMPVHLFPFDTPIDQTVMLAAMLTAVIRPLLPTAPAFAFDAPIQASGKTLICKVLSALMGRKPVISPQVDSRNDEEMRKRLFAHLLAGESVIVIDNILGEFDSPSLAAMLTSEDYSDRVLKESRTEAVPTSTLVLLSGNNMVLRGDLPRRVYRCRIDPGLENPHKREFDFDPLAVVQDHRQVLVAAALTLMKGYFATQQAARIGRGRLASFELWDDAIRQPICWLASLQKEGLLPTGVTLEGEVFPELTDPMQAIDEAVKDDPMRSQLGRLLQAWAAIVGCGMGRSTTLTVSQLTTAADVARRQKPGVIRTPSDNDETCLYDVLFEIGGGSLTNGINNRSLGRRLASFKDRVTGVLCLRAGPERQNTSTWWVEEIGGGFGGLSGILPSDTRENTSSETPLVNEKKPTKSTKPTSLRVLTGKRSVLAKKVA